MSRRWRPEVVRGNEVTLVAAVAALGRRWHPTAASLTEYWAVASPPEQAIFAVQLLRGREWTVTLAKPRLKRSCLERLRLRPDETRELSVLP